MTAKLLGHASLNSTPRYAHLDDAGVMAEIERVGRRYSCACHKQPPWSASRMRQMPLAASGPPLAAPVIDGPSHHRRTIAYFGFGQISRSILWSTADMLIGYHLVVRVGFSGATAGAILFVTCLLSALPDIFVAHWLSREADPTRLALRLQLFFGLPAALSGLLLFGPTPDASTAKVVFVVATSLIFRISYAIYDVSQNALISLLPCDGPEVARYVTVKTVTASIGRLLASFLLFEALATTADRLVDLKIVGCAVLPVVIASFALARVPVPTRSAPLSRPDGSWKSLPVGRLAIPVAAITCQIAFLGLTSKLLPLLGPERSGGIGGSSLMVAMVVGTVIGPMATHAAEILPVGRTALRAVLCTAATYAGAQLLVPHGALPGLALAFIYGASLSGIFNLIWERVARIATDHAAAFDVRIDAYAFAVLTTAIKLAIAISGIAFGAVIDGVRGGTPAGVEASVAIVGLGGLGTFLALVAIDPKSRGRIGRPGAVASVWALKLRGSESAR